MSVITLARKHALLDRLDAAKLDNDRAFARLAEVPSDVNLAAVLLTIAAEQAAYNAALR